jgi:hypothetical protein
MWPRERGGQSAVAIAQASRPAKIWRTLNVAGSSAPLQSACMPCASESPWPRPSLTSHIGGSTLPCSPGSLATGFRIRQPTFEQCDNRDTSNRPPPSLDNHTATRALAALLKMDRYGASSLHQRDSRSALFEGYNGPGADRRPVSASPSRVGGYGYGYPGGNGVTPPPGGFRSATPNSRYGTGLLPEAATCCFERRKTDYNAHVGVSIAMRCSTSSRAKMTSKSRVFWGRSRC